MYLFGWDGWLGFSQKLWDVFGWDVLDRRGDVFGTIKGTFWASSPCSLPSCLPRTHNNLTDILREMINQANLYRQIFSREINI